MGCYRVYGAAIMAMRLATRTGSNWLDQIMMIADLSLLIGDLVYSSTSEEKVDGEGKQQALAAMAVFSLLLHLFVYFRSRANREYRRRDGSRRYIAEGTQLLLLACDIVAVVLIAAPQRSSVALGVRSAALAIQGIRAVRLAVVLGRVVVPSALRRQGSAQLRQLISELTKNASPPVERNRVLLGVPSKIGTLYKVDKPKGGSYIWKIQPSKSSAVKMSGRQAVVDEFHNEVVAMHVLHTCEQQGQNGRLVPRMKWSAHEPAGNSTAKGHIAMEIANEGDLRSYTDAYVTSGDRAVGFATWLQREARRLYRGTADIQFTHGDPKAANFFVHSAGEGPPQLLFGDVGKARFEVFGIGVRASSSYRMPVGVELAEFTYKTSTDGRIKIARKTTNKGGGEVFWGFERQRERRNRMDYEDAAEVEQAVLMSSALLSASNAAFELLNTPFVSDILLSGFDKEDRHEIYLRVVKARNPLPDGSADPRAYSVNTAVQVLGGMRLSRSI